MTTGEQPRRVRANGPKIKELRLTRFGNRYGRRSLSTADLALRAKVTRRAIQLIESGARPRPYKHTIEAIAKALNVPVKSITLSEDGPS